MRSLPIILFLSFIAALGSCSSDSEGFVPSLPQGADVPTMTTLDVSTFISDSGYTKYHITTDIWRMFEDAPDPFWKFPNGLFLEQYDNDLNPVADVVCDSATYFSRRRLWRLDGNVVMVNTDRDSFLTQQLFWDQDKQTVYSDSFIHIVRFDRIIEGYGFESNQNMTSYTVNRPTGIIPVNRPEPALAAVEPEEADSTDSGAEISRRRRAPTRASQRGMNIDGDIELEPRQPAPLPARKSL